MPKRIRDRIMYAVEWFEGAITHPQDELDRWERAIRFAYDLGWFGARQLRVDRAPQMAAALSFRTLFGLLPVLLVGSLVVKGLGGFEQFTQDVRTLLDGAELDEIQLQSGEDGAVAQSLSDWIVGLLDQVDQLNLAAITWVGVAILAYSAISLLVTIESSFNAICRAPEGRSWLARLLNYWAIVTIGPAAVVGTVWVNRQLEGLFEAVVFFTVFWNFAATWLILFLVYRLMPNMRVALRATLTGAFVAAVLIEGLKQGMGWYLSNALSFKYLYGSLGLIPLFMMWVYVMWLVVLFGLEVASILNQARGRNLEEVRAARRAGVVVDPSATLAIMEVVARRFADGDPTTSRDVVTRVGLPEAAVSPLIERLVGHGILHRVAEEEDAVTLARPAATIAADRLLEIGYEASVEPTEGETPVLGALRSRLRSAHVAAAVGSDLASILAEVGREGPLKDDPGDDR